MATKEKLRTFEQREAARKAYRLWRERNLEGDRATKRASAARLRDLKRTTILLAKKDGCVDCGEKDQIVLEFDHVRGEKRFSIGGHGPSYSLKALLAEIKQCDVVCANCHRRRTFLRRPWRIIV